MYKTLHFYGNSDQEILYSGDDLNKAILNMKLLGENKVYKINRETNEKTVIIFGCRFSFHSDIKSELIKKCNIQVINLKELDCDDDNNTSFEYIINDKLYKHTCKNEEDMLKQILLDLNISYDSIKVKHDSDDFDFDDGSSYGYGYLLSINGKDSDLLKAHAGYNDASFYEFYQLLGVVLSILNPNQIYNIHYDY